MQLYLSAAAGHTDGLLYLLIGPYVNRRLNRQTLLNFAEELNLSPKQFTQINKYYSDLPFLTDEETLFAITTAFGKKSGQHRKFFCRVYRKRSV